MTRLLLVLLTLLFSLSGSALGGGTAILVAGAMLQRMEETWYTGPRKRTTSSHLENLGFRATTTLVLLQTLVVAVGPSPLKPGRVNGVVNGVGCHIVNGVGCHISTIIGVESLGAVLGFRSVRHGWCGNSGKVVKKNLIR
jgi:hypothetical protein